MYENIEKMERNIVCEAVVKTYRVIIILSSSVKVLGQKKFPL